MTRNFFSAYEAAVYAATRTGGWEMPGGEPVSHADMLGMMSAADEANGADSDNDQLYYLVNDKGSVGFTTDGGASVEWLYFAAGSRLAPQQPPAGYPQPWMQGYPFPQQSQQPASQPLSPHRAFEPKRLGFSDRFDSPEFQEALRVQKKSIKGCLLVFLIAPLVITPIYTHFSDGASLALGLLIGACISALFFFIYAVATFKNLTETPYDGTVVNKEEKEVRNYDNEQDYETWVPHYYTHIRSDDGAVHTIEERPSNIVAYKYFRLGDRVRYHANTGIPFPYEKYDKTQDTTIVCPFCTRSVDINHACCPNCGKPLLN